MPFANTLSAAAQTGTGTLVTDLREARDGGDVADSPRSDALDHRGAALLPPVTSSAMTQVLDICLAKGAGIVFLSGARHGADLQHLDVLLQVAEARAGMTAGATRIVAMAGDNPHGLLAAASFADKSARLIGLGWDSAALAVAMGAKAELGADVASNARATLLLAAAATNVVAIDTAEVEPDTDTFRTNCLHARAQGFSGKMTGTPWQVPVIQSVFAD
ncbi:aldolase/citrate lyase family protein [Neorhizobium sp. JUb45]|uniref:aldolase/citrate lyase family protein n=1 Tax=unclassified Neorhizobium TaxID=2629175 RepID=UPI00104CD0C8|nr:aldolase/citrate lyase family protein [Neorhizobium sp. JUb45]TCR05088.1 HpcH/HpaI aldolase/citrate lyase family protein [Neorhizobium sp. JUb45]